MILFSFNNYLWSRQPFFLKFHFLYIWFHPEMSQYIKSTFWQKISISLLTWPNYRLIGTKFILDISVDCWHQIMLFYLAIPFFSVCLKKIEVFCLQFLSSTYVSSQKERSKCLVTSSEHSKYKCVFGLEYAGNFTCWPGFLYCHPPQLSRTNIVSRTDI